MSDKKIRVPQGNKKLDIQKVAVDTEAALTVKDGEVAALASEQRVVSATYDFAVHGGAISTIDLEGGEAIVPANVIITQVVVQVVDELVTTDTSGTVKFLLPTDGDMTELIADQGAGLVEGKPGNFQLDGNTLTAANMGIAKKATYIKTAAARKVQATIATRAVTAGKLKCFIYYVSGDAATPA